MLRTALLVLVLAALAHGQRIRVSRTSITMDKDSSTFVDFTLDEPIICVDNSDFAECAVVITIDNPAPGHITMDNCIVKWTANEWAQTRRLRITAVENFFANGGEGTFILKTNPVISESRFYKGFNPADITVTARPRPSAHCRGTGDPHYTTFDGYYWHIYREGQYVMWSNRHSDNNLDFEMQVYANRYPARHCGFAAKEGNDIVVAQFCSGRSHRRSCGTTECRSGGFPRLSVSGNTYIVTFASGRRIRMAGTGIFVDAPGRDYKATKGICGNNNGYRPDDNPCGTGLAQCWSGRRGFADEHTPPSSDMMPTRNLFNWYPSGIVNSGAPSPHREECVYVPPPFRPPILTNPDAEDITDRFKDATKDDGEDLEFDFTDDDLNDGFEPMNPQAAENICRDVIENSAAAQACTQLIEGFTTDEFVEDCAEDLAEIGDPQFIEDAVDALERRCAGMAAAGDTSGWDLDEDGLPIPPEDLRNTLCPAVLDEEGRPQVCNNRGTCEDVRCVCEEGYSGADCSVNKALPPTAESVTRPFCDVRSGRGCGSTTPGSQEKTISVAGRNIWNSGNIKCRFQSDSHTIITNGLFLGTREVLCGVPSITLSNFQPVELQVALTTDGESYGETTATFTYYDGVCDVCTKEQGCVPNPEACRIDGKCFLNTQFNDDNICLECLPEVSTSEWTFSYEHHLECGPRFANEFTSVRLIGETPENFEIISESASNPLVEDDPNHELTYSLVHAEDAFTIDPSTGIVTTTRALGCNPNPEFGNSFVLRATDQEGNMADLSVFLEFSCTGTNPRLPEEGYEFDVAEDAAVGSVVGQVVAEDNGNVQYSWLTQEEGHAGDFEIDESTGKVTVGRELNWEAKPFYHLTVRARDSDGQFHVTSVEITVTKVPQAPTSIDVEPASVKENEPVGTVVGTLSASDRDHDEHTFEVVSGDFEVVNGNELVTTREFDFEAEPTAQVEVKGTNDDGLSVTQTLTIEIVDVNEAPIIHGLTETEFSEASPLTVLAEVLVEDPDNANDPNNQIVRCTITEDPGNYFEISQNRLVLQRKLNRVEDPEVHITIVCADNGVPVKASAPFNAVITVLDASEYEATRFVSDEPVPEDHDPSVPVGTIIAADRHEDAESITFELQSEKFVLVGEPECERVGEANTLTCTQDVKLAEGEILDYETAPEEVIVVWTNNGRRTTVTELTLTVLDVNEPPTGLMWVDGGNSIPDDAKNGDVVGQLMAIDEDVGQEHTFELLEGNDVFELQDASGARRRSVATGEVVTVVVKDASLLDAQSNPEVTLLMKVTDNGEPPLSAELETTVEVTEAPVRVFINTIGQTEVGVPENSAIDSSIGELVMTNERPGIKYTVEMMDTNAGFFDLDGMDIMLKKQLDFEVLQARMFEVRVTATVEEEGAVLPSEPVTFHDLKVIVEEVDLAPRFLQPSYTVTVDDDEFVGQTLSVKPEHVSATARGGASVIYSLVNSGKAHLFAIDAVTGVLRTAKTLTGEVEAGDFDLTVVARASDLESTVVVKVTVIDDCFENACRESEICNNLEFTYECCTADFSSCITEEAAEQRNAAGSGSGSGRGANPGMVAGIAVAIVALIALIAIIVVRRRQREPAYDGLFKNGDDQGVYSTNPTYRAPSDGAMYAAVGSNGRDAQFVPGVSNPMYEWYRPDMSRQDCTEYLMGAEDGAFVVRDSKATPGWHMLGVKTSGAVVHEKVKMNEDGMYELLPASNARQPRFADVPSLVSYYGEPRPDVPYVLTLSFSNPMYGLGTSSAGQYHYAPGTALPNDPAAPHVPLKEREKDSVARLASHEGGDIYGNTSDARVAMGSDV